MPTITKQKKIIVILLSIIAVSIAIFLFLKLLNSEPKLVSAKTFMQTLQKEANPKLYIKDRYLYLKVQNKVIKSALEGFNKRVILQNYPVEIYQKDSKILSYIAILLLFSILVAILFILRRNPNNMPTQVIKEEVVEDDFLIKPLMSGSISFDDVVGISEIKEDLEEIVEFLHNPKKFSANNITMPKGFLLVGPPGVGKTMLAKAIANEAKVPFFYQSGATFVHLYAGMGPKRVKELFKVAKEYAPSIIFIDEIDAVGKSREKFSSDEREATLNQLLVEMDGFEENSGVIVIAATNRVDILDSALLRPGRFDRKIYIDLPNFQERIQIITHYMKNKNFSLDIEYLAKITAGFSPAALNALINEATLLSFKKKKKVVTIEDIFRLKEQIVFGKKQLKLLSPKEKKIIASYLASKAVAALYKEFEFDRVSLLISFNIKPKSDILAKSDFKKMLYVLMLPNFYLQHSFGESFTLVKQDMQEAQAFIKELKANFWLDETIQEDIILQEIKEQILNDLKFLTPVIVKVAKMLNENETLSYNEIKKELDALF